MLFMRTSKHLAFFAIVLGTLLIFGAGAMIATQDSDAVVFSEYSISQAPSGIRIMNGVVENRGDILLYDLQIDVSFLAGEEEIETDFVKRQQLLHDDFWKFGMRAPANATHFRVMKIEWAETQGGTTMHTEPMRTYELTEPARN